MPYPKTSTNVCTDLGIFLYGFAIISHVLIPSCAPNVIPLAGHIIFSKFIQISSNYYEETVRSQSQGENLDINHFTRAVGII